jgi:hypothetical protein
VSGATESRFLRRREKWAPCNDLGSPQTRIDSGSLVGHFAIQDESYGPQNGQPRNPCKTAVCTDLERCKPEGSDDAPRPALHRHAQPSCPWRADRQTPDSTPAPPEGPLHVSYSGGGPPNTSRGPRTEAQTLTAWYVDCHTELGRTKPTDRQIGIVAQAVGEKLEGAQSLNTCVKG